jgi:ParB family chromosome partitioning protein
MADTTVTYDKGNLYQLDPAQLQADPNQPRKYLDPQALEELAASIVKHGVLEPILFRVAADLLYVVAGERRVEAAKKAGLATIPAIFVEGNHAEIALVENLLRQDLTAIEEAEALQALADEQKYTHEQLAGIIGKARSTITDLLSLNRLPLEIRDECRSDPRAVRTVLIEIARKKQARAMTTAYNAYKAKQQKGKATRQKKDPNESQAFFDMMDKTMAKIRSVDTAAWTDDEKANLWISLNSLKTEISNYLDTIPR